MLALAGVAQWIECQPKTYPCFKSSAYVLNPETCPINQKDAEKKRTNGTNKKNNKMVNCFEFNLEVKLFLITE